MLKLKKIKPMYTALITTADKYEEITTGAGIIDTTKTGMLKEYQRVIAVGSMVRNVSVGDIVAVNPKKYEVRKYDKNSTKEAMVEHYNPVISYNFNLLELNDEVVLLLEESDIDFVIEEYEEVPDEVKVPIIQESQGTKLILPSSVDLRK